MNPNQVPSGPPEMIAPPDHRFPIKRHEPMDELAKAEILAQSRIAHGLTEKSYQQNPAKRGDAGWVEKQRILLADMSLHLLQTSLGSGELSREDLRRNLFAILTISDELLPGHSLRAVADQLYSA